MGQPRWRSIELGYALIQPLSGEGPDLSTICPRFGRAEKPLEARRVLPVKQKGLALRGRFEVISKGGNR